MEEFAYDFLSFLPALLLLLAAAGLPVVYKVVARRFLDHAEKRMAQWLFILLDSFLTPLAGILRVVLGVAAIRALPFSVVRDATFVQYLALANDLLVILYLGLGCWRAAPITVCCCAVPRIILICRRTRRWGGFSRIFFMRSSCCSWASLCWTGWASRSAAC